MPKSNSILTLCHSNPTMTTMEAADAATHQAQAELEADRVAHAEAMAKMQAAMEQTQKRLAECSESIRAREERVLARQQSSKANGDRLEQSMADARAMLARISKEEQRLELGQDTEVSMEQQRLDRHTAALHETHVQTRRLQEDLIRKREAFVNNREALQGALEGLQTDALDMSDWFFMPASRLSMEHPGRGAPSQVAERTRALE